MKKFDFQTEAQDAVVAHAVKHLRLSRRTAITLKAPTGSGKTVMMGNVLAQLSKAVQGTHRLAILWVAPNKLHQQSYARLQALYGESKALACLLPADLTGPDIPEQAVLFLNWSSIDSETLVLRRDNETRRNLATFVDRARLSGRKVVLVVDESHLHLDSGEQAQVVVDHIIKPDLLIEVSATPRTLSPDAVVTVNREEVVAAGLIRRSIIMNPQGAPKLKGGVLQPNYDGTSENLLDAALDKQAELTRLYLNEGAPVSPLVLVQLPDRRNCADALDRLENHLLLKHGLDRENGVAVWLSEDKSPNLDDIASMSSTVRVLFFKQAVATGWDCPRAQILVALREMQSDTFTTQVLGRVVRQPEHKHYQDEALNHGYVFTNYESMKLDMDAASWLDRVQVKASIPLVLPFENWTDLNIDRRMHLPSAVVREVLKHRGMVAGCVHKGEVMALMLDGVDVPDIDTKRELQGTRAIPLSVAGLQERLDRMKAELVQATAAQGRGQKWVEKALRDAAAELINDDDEKAVLETVLHPDNVNAFKSMAECGIAAYLAAQAKAPRQLASRPSWTAPATRFLTLSEPAAPKYAKSLYQPVLVGQFERSDVEEPFARLLDSDPATDVWLKNGDHGNEHFALKYELNGESALFYVDFIVRTVEGGYRLYDTKGAGTSDQSTGNSAETVDKARALGAFTAALRAEGVDIDGGIVVHKFGQWWVHSGANYVGNAGVGSDPAWRLFKL